MGLGVASATVCGCITQVFLGGEKSNALTVDLRDVFGFAKISDGPLCVLPQLEQPLHTLRNIGRGQATVKAQSERGLERLASKPLRGEQLTARATRLGHHAMCHAIAGQCTLLVYD